MLQLHLTPTGRIDYEQITKNIEMQIRSIIHLIVWTRALPAGPGNLLFVPLGGGEGSRGGEFELGNDNRVSLKTEHLLRLLSISVGLGWISALLLPLISPRELGVAG